MNPSPSHSNLYNWLLVAFVPVLLCGFWLIDHTPFASSYFEEESIVAETENRTADRIETVNVISAPARISLGIFGVLFLMIPSRHRLKWGGPVLLLLILFFLYTGLSAAWSINPKVSVQKFLVFSFFCLAAYGLARQFTITELATVFTLICVGYIFIGVAAEIVLGNFAPHKKNYRFVGTCHPNSLAVYGSFICLVAIAYFNKFEGMNRWFILLFAIGFVTLIMTKSRTTLAGFFLASLVTFILTLKPNNRVLAFSAAMIGFIAIGMFVSLSRNNVRNAVAEKMAMGRTKDVSTLTGRLPLWELLLESVEEKPLIGHGYLAYWDKEKIEFLTDQLKWEIPHGHNMYIDVLLDGGVVGLGIYVCCFVAALTVAGHRSLMFTDRESVLVCGFVTFALIHGFAESLFKLPTFLLFILIALVLRLIFQPAPNAENPDVHTVSPNPILPQPLPA